MFKKTTKKARLFLIVLILPILVLSCKDGGDDKSVSSTASTDNKVITAFSFTAAANTALSSDVTATISGTDITAKVPSGTDMTALVATFTTTGKSVTVGSTTQVSDTTANDFSSAVTYTVIAVNSSTQDYTVTVKVIDAKEITTFSFITAENASLSNDVIATISGISITATVPYVTDLNALVATFTITGKSVSVDNTTQVSGTTVNDFSSSVIYTVIAEDDSTRDYTVTVAFPTGESVSYIVGSVYFSMVYLPGGLTFKTGTGDIVRATVTDSYQIGQTEVTYELWYAVYTWATTGNSGTGAGLYTFANAGSEGHDGTIGALDTNQEPVTVINWRDAMVWANALTEYQNTQNGTNLKTVYRYNRAIIRDSRDSNATACDNAVVNSIADGFRLLTSDEWELAARYIDDANNDGDIVDTNEYYPGSYVSGADTQYDATTGGSDIDGDSDVKYTTDVAVYSGNSNLTTAVVKSKSPNALGLYDMSGNVWEWVFDLSGSYRVRRGGGWGSSADFMRVGHVSSYYPYNEINNIGFRLARTQ